MLFRSGKAKPAVKEEVEQIDEVSPPGMEKMTGSKHAKASFAKQYGKRGKSVMYATAWKQYNKKKAVKEETEQITEAGAANFSKQKSAYDRARIGSRGVNNPERKQQMRDAYYKQREKVEASKAKRVAAGTFDKARELEAHHKRLDVIAAKRAAGKAGKDQVRVAEAAEQIDELSKATKDAYVAKRGSQLSSMLSGHTRGKQLTGKRFC